MSTRQIEQEFMLIVLASYSSAEMELLTSWGKYLADNADDGA